MVGLVLLKGVTYWKSLGNTALDRCKKYEDSHTMPVTLILTNLTANPAGFMLGNS